MGLKFSVSVRLQRSVPATHLCVMMNTYLTYLREKMLREFCFLLDWDIFNVS